MRKYTDEQIQQAKSLRETHKYSFNYLHQLTEIPASTLKNWCANEFIITRSSSFLANNERRRKNIKQSELAALNSLKTINTNTAKIFVSLLYWCEGAKYPASNALQFVNSDPSLMNTYITLLRKAFILDELKFRIQLQIHTTHNYEEVRNMWSKLLRIPTAQFIKPTITEKRGGKHRADYQGTCSLKYQDVALQLKVIGIYEGVSQLIAKQISPSS